MTESSGVTSVCVLLDVICELLSPIMWLQDNERSYLVSKGTEKSYSGDVLLLQALGIRKVICTYLYV